MVKTAALRSENGSHFKVVKNFDDLLGANPYAFLSEDVLLYKNDKGKYVIFTIDPGATYTVDDYMKLPEGTPFELLDGKLIYMPSPKSKHQAVSLNLSASLHAFVRKNKLGTVLAAPMDVHLDQKNICQPDILFLSNERKDRHKEWIYGAPDLMVEIISPGSKLRDRKHKFKLYEKHGVLEYWLIDPEKEEVEVHILAGKKFTRKGIYKANDILISSVIRGFEISAADIFENGN